MDMEDMRTDPMIYINKEEFMQGIKNFLPTLFWLWLLLENFDTKGGGDDEANRR